MTMRICLVSYLYDPVVVLAKVLNKEAKTRDDANDGLFEYFDSG